MKRTTKIALVLVVLGAILIGIGWWNHGDKGVVWSHDSRSFQVIRRSKLSYQPGAYDKIVVDAQAPVTIKAGNTDRVTASYLDNTQGRPTATVSKGTLTVRGGRTTKQKSQTIVGFSDDDYSNGGVLITVPRNKHLTSIDVKRENSGVSLRDLTVKQVNVKSSDDISLMNLTVQKDVMVASSDGDVWASQVKANRLQVTADDGDIGISDSRLAATNNQLTATDGDVRVSETKLGGGHLATADGDVHLQNNRLTKTLTASTDDGDITAHIAKTAGAKVVVKDADMGDIKVKGHARHSGYWLHPNATSQYKLTSADGDVTVGTD